MPLQDVDRYQTMWTEQVENVPQLPKTSEGQVLITTSASELPEFSGEVLDYQTFRADFLCLIVSFPVAGRLRLLKKCLGIRAKQIIATCVGPAPATLLRAFKLLDAEYDRPDMVKQEMLQQITKLVNQPCAFDEGKFAQVVYDIREKYDQLLIVALCLLRWLGILGWAIYQKSCSSSYQESCTKILKISPSLGC